MHINLVEEQQREPGAQGRDHSNPKREAVSSGGGSAEVEQ